MMKINIFFEEIQEVAIYFRYYDENNYYVIKMNVPKQKKIEIYKKVAGFESLIDTDDESFIEMIWYRFFIVFHNDELKLYKQTGDIRRIKLVFDIENNDVQRGKVALSTNGDATGVFFDGFQVTDYDPQYGIIDEKYTNHRGFPTCLLPASKSKRQNFFEQRYHLKHDAGHKNLIINYCADCCSSFIEAWERLLHYGCQKACVNVTRNYEREVRDKINKPAEK